MPFLGFSTSLLPETYHSYPIAEGFAAQSKEGKHPRVSLQARASHFITLCLYRNRCSHISLFFWLTLAQSPTCHTGKKSDKSVYIPHYKFSKTRRTYTVLGEDTCVHSVCSHRRPLSGMNGWNDGLCDQTSWVWMPTLPFTSFMILDKLFSLSVPLFPPWCNV